MVCLNEVLPFNKIKLRDNIYSRLKEKISLEFETELNKKIIEKINRNIQENIKEMFSNNYFLYLNIDDNHCVHMFKKGKNEGYYCTKKIKTNLPDNSGKDFLCTRHSKKHIPKKKRNKDLHEISKSSVNYEISKNSVNYKKNINYSFLKINNTRIIKNKFKINKNKKNKFKLKVYGEINFNNIMKKLYQEISP